MTEWEGRLVGIRVVSEDLFVCPGSLVARIWLSKDCVDCQLEHVIYHYCQVPTSRCLIADTSPLAASRLGLLFTSSSQHFMSESMMTSNPNSSKQCVSLAGFSLCCEARNTCTAMARICSSMAGLLLSVDFAYSELKVSMLPSSYCPKPRPYCCTAWLVKCTNWLGFCSENFSELRRARYSLGYDSLRENVQLELVADEDKHS